MDRQKGKRPTRDMGFKIKSQVHSWVGPRVWGQIGRAANDRISTQVRSPIGAIVWGQVGYGVWEELMTVRDP